MAVTYSMMPTALIMEAPNLATVKVWHHIFVSVFGRNGKWDLSHQQIADAVGCNRVTVKRAVAWLAENGWVTQHFQGDRRPYRYEVFIPGGDTHPTGSPDVPSKAAGSPDDPRTGSLDDPSTGSLDDPHQERVPGESSRRETSTPLVNRFFDDFWEAYPRKVGKGAARTAYVKALRKTDAATILAAVYTYVAAAPTTEWAHPTTWLNQERWLDEYGTEPPAKVDSKPSKSLQALDLAARMRAAEEAAEGQQSLGYSMKEIQP